MPDNIGGRYSVLTAVGLLPIAVAGIDIDALMDGAADMMRECALADMNANPAWQYAGARYELYRTGKKIELLAAYEPCFRFMSEWWKQLYGESEGKENKGLFPASVEFTADLHSMGQYIQEGERHLFETVVRFGPSQNENPVPYDEGNGDGLNFLAGKSMDFIRQQAMDGTLLAHVEGGVPNVTLRTGSVNEQTLGGLIYFFEYACGLSGYLLDVNPFDQPGVEAYKKICSPCWASRGMRTCGRRCCGSWKSKSAQNKFTFLHCYFSTGMVCCTQVETTNDKGVISYG